MLNYVSQFVGKLCRINNIGRGERKLSFFHSVNALIVKMEFSFPSHVLRVDPG